MTVRYLIPKDGQFYKANLHSHSTCSDGYLKPEELKQAYKEHGYQIVVLTDHRVCIDHSELNDEEFLFLSGCELDNMSLPEENRWQKACHICCIARRPGTYSPMIQLKHGGPMQVNETVRELMDAGFIIHYNHPVWSAHSTEDYTQYEGLSGFEIYNNCAEVYGMEGNALHDYALFLKSGKRAYPVAADDNHNMVHKRRFISDSFGGFNMIKAPELSYNSIIAALEAGHTYASTGPIISEYILSDKELSVKCSPVSKAILKSSHVGLNRQNFIMASDTITEVIFDLSDIHDFAYIQLMAADGSFACTAPVFEEQWLDSDGIH